MVSNTMHRNVSMGPDALVSQTAEALAQQLIAKYPEGQICAPELLKWEASPWAIAIRLHDCPVAVVRGSYQEIRAFEIAWQKIKRAMPSQVLSSKGDQIYDVTATSCTCKGFHYRGHCRHVDEFREHMVAEA